MILLAIGFYEISRSFWFCLIYCANLCIQFAHELIRFSF